MAIEFGLVGGQVGSARGLVGGVDESLGKEQIRENLGEPGGVLDSKQYSV